MPPKKTKYGCTPWGAAFIEALGSSCGRLERGKTIANTGKVWDTTMEGTAVTAKVKGSYSPYYNVSIKFRKFPAEEQQKVFAIIEQDPIVLGHIMNGELPSSLLSAISKGVKNCNLLPVNFHEVSGKCNCPDNAGGGGYFGGSCKSSSEPCKHQAGVYYVLTSEIDKNPFRLFLLRGMDLQKRFSVSNSVRVPYPLPIESADANARSSLSTLEPSSDDRNALALAAIGGAQNQASFILSCLQAGPSFLPSLDYREVMMEFYRHIAKDKNLEMLAPAADHELWADVEPLLRSCRLRLRMQSDVTRAVLHIAGPVDMGDGSEDEEEGSSNAHADATLATLAARLSALGVKHVASRSDAGDAIVALQLRASDALPLLLGMHDSFGSRSFSFFVACARLALKLLRRAAVIPDVLPLPPAEHNRFKVIWKPLGSDEAVSNATDALQALYPCSPEFDLGGAAAMEGVCQSAHAGTRQTLAVLVTCGVKALGFMHSKQKKNPPPISKAFFSTETFVPLSLQEASVASSVSRWVGVFDLLKLHLHVKIRVALVPAQSSSLSLAMSLRARQSSSREDSVRAFIAAFPHERTTVLQFLSSLGRYLPGVERLLSTDEMVLSGALFESFITASAATLGSLGCEMLMPKSLQKLMRPRLVLHASADSKSLRGNQSYQTFVDVQGLLQFEWKVAIGDQVVSVSEFEKMVQSGTSVVAFKDGYVALDASEVSGMLQRARADPNSEARAQKLSAMDLVRESLTSSSRFTFSHELHSLVRRLSGRSAPEMAAPADAVPVPEGLRATMRPYQLKGFHWLVSHAANRMGCLLCDDMGLGKTLQTIALMLHLSAAKQRAEAEAGHARASSGFSSLVVVPTSLLLNWQREVRKFAPGLRCEVYYGNERELLVDRLLAAQRTPCKPSSGSAEPAPKRQRRQVELAALAAGAGVHVVLTSYGTCKRDTQMLTSSASRWDLLVVDEAQAIKNAASQVSKVVKGIAAHARVALSGTPVENKLAELHSLFDFALPGLLGSLKVFGERFSKPIERYKDDAMVQQLRRITGPFLLRRMKTDKSIIADLPPKVASDDLAVLHPAQASLYESVVQRHLAEIEAARSGEGGAGRGLVLKLITALKQICNHPTSFSAEAAVQHGAAAMDVEDEEEGKREQSGKVELLLELLAPVLAAGEKAIIFTQYRGMAGLLTSIISRRCVRRFETDPTAQLMIITLKAGGVGLNLTAANHVIHFDLWWNPAVENQATDRAFRIGQQRTVFVHRLITKNTFEEKINRMLQVKRELSELTVAAGEEWLGDLSPAELRDLFALSSSLSEDQQPA